MSYSRGWWTGNLGGVVNLRGRGGWMANGDRCIDRLVVDGMKWSLGIVYAARVYAPNHSVNEESYDMNHKCLQLNRGESQNQLNK
ncbi:hypothetical protein FKM82_029888 [Ascaphus truei]